MAPDMRSSLPILLVFVSVAAATATDPPGSRDPLNLARFPHAWIVDYQHDETLLPREFIIGRVDKSRRDVYAERKVRADAQLETATYRIPDGTPRQEVVAHYQKLLSGGSLFSCEGRDCGRSNHWANYIFGQAKLFGPDRNQYYIAVNQETHLVGVYIIERGNKRVYAHLVVLEPTEPVAVSGNQILTEHLAGDGYAVLQGITPSVDGSLPASAREALQGIAGQLSSFSGQRVYVVCHIYGPAGVQDLLAASDRCSVATVALLAGDDGPELVSFAAGPLLPRATGAVSRIELILPQRLQH